MKKAATLMICTALGLTLAAAAAAQDDAEDVKEKAKEHFLKGKALVEEGAPEKAVVELRKSYELHPVPIVLYNIAISYDQMHKYADAVRYYGLYLESEAQISQEDRVVILGRVEELKKFLGGLSLTVDVEGADVLIDNSLVGQTPLDPVVVETGEHDLTVRKKGYPDIKEKITIISGEVAELSLSFGEAGKGEEGPEGGKEPVKKKKERKKLGKTPFIVMAALTGASALVMAITGGVALKKDGEVADMYDNTHEWRDVADERDRLAWGTNAMIGVTAACAAATLVLVFFTDFRKDGKEKKAQAFLSAGPAADGLGLSLGGSF